MADSTTVQTVLTIVAIVVPWLLAVGAGVYAFYLKNKRLPSTIAEWQSALSNVVADRDKVVNILTQIKNFFNPETPMSETTIEVIKEEIPANSYQMSDESQALVLSYCASEEEKQRVLSEITMWENPTKTGEECCVYTLDTTGATFRVQYGVPELIVLKSTQYEYLSQQKIAEIVETLGSDNQFSIMTKIMMNERNLVKEYELETDKGKILVKDGTYTAI